MLIPARPPAGDVRVNLALGLRLGLASFLFGLGASWMGNSLWAARADLQPFFAGLVLLAALGAFAAAVLLLVQPTAWVVVQEKPASGETPRSNLP